MGGVGTFGVFACVQEVAVTPGELLADADLIHYTMGASEKDVGEAIRKAGDFSTTARRAGVLTFDTLVPASGSPRAAGAALCSSRRLPHLARLVQSLQRC